MPAEPGMHEQVIEPRSVLTAKDYKTDVEPIWCAGCGHYSVLAAVSRALADMQLDRKDTAVISGIGCSSRMPAYIDSYGFHGVHGRALPVASGLKAARPDLTVIVAGGDGDGYSIGGNHFLHACRRNMDMLYIVMDNQVYGMTKGQSSPTTAADWENKLQPHGTGVRPFKPLAVALAAGASFIARGFSGNPSRLAELITAGVQHRGFAFLEVLSPCITYRPEQMGWKKLVTPVNASTTDNAAEAAARIFSLGEYETGLFYQSTQPVWQRAGTDAPVPVQAQAFAAEFLL